MGLRQEEVIYGSEDFDGYVASMMNSILTKKNIIWERCFEKAVIWESYVYFTLLYFQCAPGGCLMELAQQLVIIMIGKQLINNVQEVMIPYVPI